MKKILLMLVLLTSLITHAQNVAINNDASLPHNSAILDIKSGTKGLLIPRMTTAAIIAIVNPAKGLLVLDTVKNQLIVNMGTSVAPNWQNMVASSGWSLTGNAGTDPNTQFIGTLDTKPFIIRVNNVRSGYIDTITMNASYGFRSLDSVTSGVGNTAIGFKSLLRNKTGYENTGIGWTSLSNNSTGYNNTGIGTGALFSNTNGFANVAVGAQNLFNNTTGSHNTASGLQALANNTTGSFNTASGVFALYYNSTGINNTAIGQSAMLFNTIGNYNIGIGSDALSNSTSGNDNVAIGFGTLASSESGYSNVAVGSKALFYSTNRSNLVAIGDSALYYNGYGASYGDFATANTAVGSKALFSNTYGYHNTAMGSSAMTKNTTGFENVAIGMSSLRLNTTGYHNTATGYNALSQNTTATDNTATGFDALKLNETGEQNTAMGSFSLPMNVYGSANTSVGAKSLFNSQGNANTAVGWNTLWANTYGHHNTAIGLSALNNNVTGAQNSGLGYAAEVGSADLDNATVIGAYARVDCSNCMVLGAVNGINGATSNVNVGIGTTVPDAPLTFGNSIGKKITLYSSGPDNYYGLGIQGGLLQIHSDASSADIAFGYGSSTTFTERMRIKGSGNVGIGTTAPAKRFEVVGPASGIPVTLVVANRGGFGAAAIEFVSNYAVADQWRPGYIRSADKGVYTGSLDFYTNGSGIGTLYNSLKGFEVSNGVAYTATGTVGAYSDARLKNNISAFTDGLNVINKINPVQFYYNADAPFNTDHQQVGVIAQDLEKIAPYMIEKNKQNGYDDLRTVNNQAYTFLLINAVKDQQQQIEKQQKQIETSNDEVKQLKAELADIKKIVEQLIKSR